MNSFQALMALSHTQTKLAAEDVQNALAERTRREEEKQRKAEERDRKEQELARKHRLMIFEEEKKQRERQLKREQEQAAIEAERQKRAEMERNSYQHGPKKAKALSDGSAPKWPSSASQTRTQEEVRKRRLPDDDDDGGGSAPEFLTREEKRQRKQQQEMRRLFHSTKRSTTSHLKAGRRLPGGAVDVMTGSQSASNSSPSVKSVRERLTAMPNTLTKLNTVKRDTRTIDEIMQDRAKLREGKTLEGDQARGFDNWFTDKKEFKKMASTSNAPSGANTPSSRRSATPQLQILSTKSTTLPKPTPSKTAASKTAVSSLNVKTSSANFKPNSSSTKSNSFYSSKALNGIGGGKTSASAGKKRPRSPSLSEESDVDSAPPPRRQAGSGYSDAIWQMFGKNRDRYVNQDVFSDDEDMEADASVLEREELQSARLAKKEDQLALEQERRHEEEKRRRKKEKERQVREMRG